MDARVFGMESPLFTALHHLMDIPAAERDKSSNAPTRTYVRDARAMAATHANVKELPGSYAFVIDMPGLKSGEIKVQVEDGNVLVISGERRREEDDDKEGGKYLCMEWRAGKFMRKFSLPYNANADAISAVYQDRVLTVTVEKLPPPEPKKPKKPKIVVDMPGLMSGEIKVQVEDGNVLVISGERRREDDDDKEGGKYLRMEQRAGKFMRKFSLPDNANADAVSAVYRDGVLTVTVEKLPLPPQPKKTKTVEVKVA